MRAVPSPASPLRRAPLLRRRASCSRRRLRVQADRALGQALRARAPRRSGDEDLAQRAAGAPAGARLHGARRLARRHGRAGRRLWLQLGTPRPSPASSAARWPRARCRRSTCPRIAPRRCTTCTTAAASIAQGPAVLVRKSMLDRVSLSGSYYVDAVSNASIDVVTTASKYKETRNQGDVGPRLRRARLADPRVRLAQRRARLPGQHASAST